MKDENDNKTIDLVDQSDAPLRNWSHGLNDDELYCPVCGRVLKANNSKEVDIGLHDGFIFVHDEVPHNDSDIDALEVGIQ